LFSQFTTTIVLQNIESSADSWFNASNSDEGEQFEYAEGNYETAWKIPANYFSLIKVILVKLMSESSHVVLKLVNEID